MKKLLLVFLFLSFCVPYSLGLETARVRVRGGVPVIELDGVPVRGRMFYGGPAGKRNDFDSGPQWKKFSFEFTPLTTVERGATIHFRFGTEPGKVWLDDVEIDDLTTGQPVAGPYLFESGANQYSKNWVQWPPLGTIPAVTVAETQKNGANGSDGLEIVFTRPKNGSLPDFHIYHRTNLTFKETNKYRISFSVRSDRIRTVNVAAYKPGASFERIDGSGRNMFRDSMKYAKESGAPFVNFGIPLPWPKPGQNFDFSDVDRRVEETLRLNPDALLIPRIPMDPPGWWLGSHPGDRLVWQGPGLHSRSVATPASEQFREDSGKCLAQLVEHLEKKYPKNFAGYMPCGQNTGEWFYQDTWGPSFNGYATADTVSFRKWLRAKYQSDEALQKSWNESGVTLTDAEVPSQEYRKNSMKSLFNDIRTDRKIQAILDFNEFQQEMMAETVLHYAKICREKTNGRKMVVFFYGYLYEFAAVQNGPGISGHYALSRLLKSPDIDIICSPISYNDRQAGGYAPAMTAAESVQAAGKLWLFEDDTRTYLNTLKTSFPGSLDGESTQENTRHLLLRNTAECMTRNFATWWMDLFQVGWFDDPVLWKEMKLLEGPDRYFLANPTPFQPEIATFIDEKSMLALPNNRISTSMIYKGRIPFGRLGAPYGAWLLTDLLEKRTAAKLNAFIGTFRLSRSERAKIREVTAGKFNLWGFGAGYLDMEKGSDPSAIQELTGFKVDQIKNPADNIILTSAGKEFGLTESWGKGEVSEYFMTVTDALPNEILAVYPNGKAAIALRTMPNGSRSLFCGVPRLTSDFLRATAKNAGVHLFTDKDCNVYANGPYVALHGANDGKLLLNTGRNDSVFELRSGKIIGTGPTISVSIRKGETKLLRIDGKR